MNNDNILVSIIVPLYNVEKYVDKCVNSLLNQEHKNIEIILVDDGSPDSSGIIADNLANTDDRILVIHQKNSGVSSARNAGIASANGEYLMFVDGDDWVDTDYVSYFLSLVINNHCDVGVNTINHRLDNYSVESNEEVLNAEKCIENIYAGKLDVAVWNKIYSRKLLDNNKIIFDNNIWYGEGMLFNIEVFQYVDKIAVGNKAVYHQTFNTNSAMRKFNLESNKCGIRSLDIQKTKWIKVNDEIEAQWRYHKYRFNQSIINGIVRTNSEKEYSEELRSCISSVRRNISVPLKSEKNIKNRLYWILYFLFPIVMAKRSAKIYKRNAIMQEKEK